jgi:cytochrome c oxidase subunit I
MVTTTSPETSVAPGRTYAPRRRAGSVIWEWMTTVDHKKIGCMYIALGTIYFIVGGVEALLIRVQLATPNERALSPSQYDQIFAMHATTMIFLFFIPVMAGFANYFFPLMIGARDSAPSSSRWGWRSSF